MNKNFLKTLKKQLINITMSEVSTDKGVVSVEGEKIVEGAEVTITNEEGEEIPAEDGEYTTDEFKFTVKDGKVESVIAEVKEAEVPEEEVKEEMEEQPEAPETEQPEAPETDEKDAKIAELEAALAEKDAEIEALKAEIEELKNKAEAPVEEPVDMKPVVNEQTYKSSGALRYFQN